MLWTIALVVLFTAVTVLLARTLRERRSAPAAGRQPAFHDALRRLAALADSPPAAPSLRAGARVCPTCESFIPEEEEGCLVCALEIPFDLPRPQDPAREELVPAVARRQAPAATATRR